MTLPHAVSLTMACSGMTVPGMIVSGMTVPGMTVPGSLTAAPRGSGCCGVTPPVSKDGPARRGFRLASGRLIRRLPAGWRLGGFIFCRAVPGMTGR